MNDLRWLERRKGPLNGPMNGFDERGRGQFVVRDFGGRILDRRFLFSSKADRARQLGTEKRLDVRDDDQQVTSELDERDFDERDFDD